MAWQDPGCGQHYWKHEKRQTFCMYRLTAEDYYLLSPSMCAKNIGLLRSANNAAEQHKKRQTFRLHIYCIRLVTCLAQQMHERQKTLGNIYGRECHNGATLYSRTSKKHITRAWQENVKQMQCCGGDTLCECRESLCEARKYQLHLEHKKVHIVWWSERNYAIRIPKQS